MSNDREKAKSANVGSDGLTSNGAGEALVDDLRAQRLAALNLMEDAIAAQELAERANVALCATEIRRTFVLMLGDAIKLVSDPIDIQNVACRVVGEYIDANRAIYAEIDDQEAFVSGSWVRGVQELPEQLCLTSFAKRLIESPRGEEVLSSTDVADDERFSAEDLERLRALEIGAFVAFRLAVGDTWVASFAVQSKEPRQWTDLELYLIRVAAERTWDAVGRARVEERLKRKTAVVEGINLIFTEAMTSRSDEALGQVCLDVVERVTGSELSFLAEINTETGLLDLVAVSEQAWTAFSANDSQYASRKLPSALGIHGIYGRVLTDSKGLFTNDPASHPDRIGTPEGHLPLTSFLGVPLVHAGKTVGLMGLGNRPGGFRREDLESAEAFAPAILQALLNKRSDEAQREAEQRLSLLSESFRDFAIFTTDVQGRVVTWNPGAEHIFGYRESEIIGQEAHMLFVPEDQAKGIPELEMRTARQIGRAADERWHLRKDGSHFFASGIMAPLHDRNVLIGYAKIARDLTIQKQTEEELHQHRDRLEQLIAGRTAELAQANQTLRIQMQELRRIEKERVELLQKIVTTQEDERRRIARDMHDSLGQQLTAMRLKLASIKTELYGDSRLGESLETLQEVSKRIDAEVNFLVWELRPTVLDDLGLVAAIETYVREWSKHYGIPAEFHAGRPTRDRLDGNVETNLYRITQEALNNTHKHANAQNANVVLETRNNEIVLVIEDDGVGFDSDQVKAPSRSGRGLGLVG
ncbi:MAG TPA: GAF domain-containing protein, partial [Pyrinomonadaceae bacterium]|nr:GAF domain-containing protein [Pyrinomonadaceae bacterium]